MGTADPNIGVGCKVAGASVFVLGKLFGKFDFRTPAFRVLAGVEKGRKACYVIPYQNAVFCVNPYPPPAAGSPETKNLE